MANNVVRVLDAAHVRNRDLDVELRRGAKLATIATGERQRAAAERIRELDALDQVHRIARAAERHIEVARLGEVA